jgi:hypothetical protein
MDWIGFFDHLHTPLGTKSNYSATANLHTLQIPQHPLSPSPACCVFTSRSLGTASKSGYYSASRAHVVTVRRISRNWALVDCQLNYSTVSSQPPLQSSTQLPTLNWLSPRPAAISHQPHIVLSIDWLSSELYSAGLGRTQQETPPPTIPLFLLGGLPSSNSDIVDVFISHYQATHIHSRCRCIVTLLHATVYCMAAFVWFCIFSAYHA